MSHGAFAIMSYLSISSCGIAVNVSAIDCAKSIFEEGKELVVLLNFKWDRIVIMWQMNIVGVE